MSRMLGNCRLEQPKRKNVNRKINSTHPQSLRIMMENAVANDLTQLRNPECWSPMFVERSYPKYSVPPSMLVVFLSIVPLAQKCSKVNHMPPHAVRYREEMRKMLVSSWSRVMSFVVLVLNPPSTDLSVDPGGPPRRVGFVIFLTQ